jgi:hypothetical protein
MAVTYSSEMPGDFQQTTYNYIWEDKTIQVPLCRWKAAAI